MSAETVNILNMRQLASGHLQAVRERRNSLNKGTGPDDRLTARPDLQCGHSPTESGFCSDKARGRVLALQSKRRLFTGRRFEASDNAR